MLDGASAELARRLSRARQSIYGDAGRPELARSIGVALPAWEGYEAGCPMPGEVLLQFMDVTGVRPEWLISGDGPMLIDVSPSGAADRDPETSPHDDVA